VIDLVNFIVEALLMLAVALFMVTGR